MLSILQSILNTSVVFVIWTVFWIHYGMYLYFEFCTFKMVSKNTLRTVYLMCSLMADWCRWRYSSWWRNNSRLFFRRVLPDEYSWRYFSASRNNIHCLKSFCAVTHFVLRVTLWLHCTGLVVVVHDCLYCILYFLVKIQKNTACVLAKVF